MSSHLLFPVSVKPTHKRSLLEVVFWRRRWNRPFQCTAVFPRIVRSICRSSCSNYYIKQEYENANSHHQGTHCTYQVQSIKALTRQIRKDTALHTHEAKEVLYEES
ncbi:hypothetical protein D3C81_1292090 [compost metagenome]